MAIKVLPRTHALTCLLVFILCMFVMVSVWLYPRTVFQGFNQGKTEHSKQMTIQRTRLIVTVLSLISFITLLKVFGAYPLTLAEQHFTFSKIPLSIGKDILVGPLSNLQGKGFIFSPTLSIPGCSLRSFRLQKSLKHPFCKVEIRCVVCKNDHEEAVFRKTIWLPDKKNNDILISGFEDKSGIFSLCVHLVEKTASEIELSGRFAVALKLKSIFNTHLYEVFNQTSVTILDI